MLLEILIVDYLPNIDFAIAPMWIASALGAVASGAGTALGAYYGGKAQVEAQQLANEANLQIHREQMEYQTKEREATQAYNTPEEQRKRYEQAGINPYFALSNINGGNATAQSAPSAPTIQPVNGMANAYQQIGASIGDALGSIPNTIMQMKSMNADIEGKLLDNRSKVISLKSQNDMQILDLEQKRADLSASKLDSKTKERNLEILDEQLEQARLQSQYLTEYLEGRNEEQRNNAKLSYEKVQTERLQRDISRADLKIRRALADSTIKLNTANENQLIELKNKLIQEAYELKQNGISERLLKSKMKNRLDEELKQMKIDTDTKQRVYDNYWPIIDPIIDRISKLGATLIGAAGLVYGSKLPKAAPAAAVPASQTPTYGFTNMP